MKTTLVNRLLLLAAGFLAAYQVAFAVDGLGAVPIAAYTVGFGALLVACLMIIILGLDVLDSPVVVIVSTLIPLSLALGLSWEYLPGWRIPCAIFAAAGFVLVLLSRSFTLPGRLPLVILVVTHGVAGMTIFLLPSILAADGSTHSGFALVGLGGALMSIGGLLLSFLRVGKPIVPRETILRIFPALLFLMTVAFVAGFALG